MYSWSKVFMIKLAEICEKSIKHENFRQYLSSLIIKTQDWQNFVNNLLLLIFLKCYNLINSL